MNPITLWLEWLHRRRCARAIAEAERRRAAIARQIDQRRARKAEWRPMAQLLRDATNASLRASCGRMGRV